MSCNLTAGWAIDCKDSQGGVDMVYIANGKVSGYTASAGVVSEILVGGVALTGADFFSFAVPKQTSTLEEEIEASTENGTVLYTQTLTLVFNKMEASKRNQILLMAQNENLVPIVRDGNGKLWVIGLERGATLTGGTNTTGTAYTDRNGGELTLTGYEKIPMFEVNPSILEVPEP